MVSAAISHEAITKTLSNDERIANALWYRFNRAQECDNAFWHELLSDFPHARDFVNSLQAVILNVIQLNIPALTQYSAALLFSSGGLAASIPNISAIVHDQREEMTELRATLKLYNLFAQTHDKQQFEQEQALELEGIPDTGVHILTSEQLKKIRGYAFKTRLERVGETLRKPSLDVFKAGVLATCHFWYTTAKDIALNVSTQLFKNIDCTIAGLALWQKCRKERALLKSLVQITPIKEKIERINKYVDQPELQRNFQAEIDHIGQSAIDHLDQMQKALRDKAKLLRTANQGFTLQAAFIACSFAACILHLGKGNMNEAALQLSGGSLAFNPLRFVGEQAKVLYDALHSERAEAAQKEDEILERLMPKAHETVGLGL